MKKVLALLTGLLFVTATAFASPLTADAGVEHWVTLMIAAGVLLVALIVFMLVRKKKHKE